MDLRDLLNCEVNVVTDDGMHERMRQRVLRDALALEDIVRVSGMTTFDVCSGVRVE